MLDQKRSKIQSNGTGQRELQMQDMDPRALIEPKTVQEDDSTQVISISTIAWIVWPHP